MPAGQAGGVYDALMQAGGKLGARNAGYYAVDLPCFWRRLTAPGAAS